MEQETGISSLYDEFLLGYVAENGLVCPDFSPDSPYKPTSTPCHSSPQPSRPSTVRGLVRRTGLRGVPIATEKKTTNFGSAPIAGKISCKAQSKRQT
jgi:hypothetical protein